MGLSWGRRRRIAAFVVLSISFSAGSGYGLPTHRTVRRIERLRKALELSGSDAAFVHAIAVDFVDDFRNPDFRRGAISLIQENYREHFLRFLPSSESAALIDRIVGDAHVTETLRRQADKYRERLAAQPVSGFEELFHRTVFAEPDGARRAALIQRAIERADALRLPLSYADAIRIASEMTGIPDADSVPIYRRLVLYAETPTQFLGLFHHYSRFIRGPVGIDDETGQPHVVAQATAALEDPEIFTRFRELRPTYDQIQPFIGADHPEAFNRQMAALAARDAGIDRPAQLRWLLDEKHIPRTAATETFLRAQLLPDFVRRHPTAQALNPYLDQAWPPTGQAGAENLYTTALAILPPAEVRRLDFPRVPYRAAQTRMRSVLARYLESHPETFGLGYRCWFGFESLSRKTALAAHHFVELVPHP
jgi:hypothetical protein